MGTSANSAVIRLRTRHRPLCAVTMSNQASHRSRTLVTMDAATATCRCLQSAHAVVPRQANKTMSKPVQANGQLPTR